MTDTTTDTAKLEALIRGYQDSYYNGEAEISDAEFDALWDKLKTLKPDSPVIRKIGADAADGFPKSRHLIPMGSQEKAANPAEFRAWVEKRTAAAFVVQYKLDGASLELQFENGRLVRALTRGDGVTGDDITANAKKMRDVVCELDTAFSGGVRGEVVMTHSVWHAKYQDKANCRNAANGIMRRKDGAGCEDLCLITYDASASGDDAFFKNEIEKIGWLAARGFAVTETREFSGVEEIIAWREETAKNRTALPFDIDGLVVKEKETNMEDLRRARPERQIAFKFELEQAVSILRAVEWSESGATYTPIGIVDPVRLAGTTVKRANLNNPGMIRALGLQIGSAVVIVKRGEIIPKIEGVAGEGQSPVPILIPAECGTCHSTLVDEGTRLYCPNPGCPKRLLHRLLKWAAVLDIRELGEKLCGQLFEKGRVLQPADLYTLTAAELAAYERMGELSAAKVIRHIRAPRSLSLAAFVAGFDFEGVGETIMDKVAAAGFDTLEKLRAATVPELAGVYGLGDITARTIVLGLAETGAEMDAVLAARIPVPDTTVPASVPDTTAPAPVPDTTHTEGGRPIISIAPPVSDTGFPLRGKSFCFTGELATMKRAAAEARVKALGGSVKSSVVKDLSFLVTNDSSSTSGKNKKARSLGIPVLDEAAFQELTGVPVSDTGAGD